MTNPSIPEPGYFKCRLVRGAPWLPIVIYHRASQPDRSPMWVAMRDGEFVDIFDVWPGCSGQRITEAEFNFLIASRQHDKVYGDPDPRKPVDFNKLPTIF